MLPRRSKHLALGVLALMLTLAGCSGDSGAPSAPSGPAAGPPAKAAPAGPPAKAAQAAPPPAPMYAYEAKGRPDPFRPLIMPPKPKEPKVAKKITDEKETLSVNELKLAGIVWDRRGYFALVEAPNGKGYVLRVNDTIGEDTKVTKITPDTVTFEIKMETPLPQARTRQVELTLKKED